MFIILFVYLFILIAVGYFSIIKNSLINVYSIIAFSLCIVYILPYLNPNCPYRSDQYFALLISVGLIGFLISFFLISLLRKKQSHGKLCLSGYYPRKKCRSKVLSILAATGVILIWFSIFLAFPSLKIDDIIAFILRDRIREYQEVALDYGHFFNFLESFLKIPLYLEMFRLWKYRRRLGWFYFATLILEVIVFSHTRFVILILLALPFIYQHFYVRPISSKKIMILMVFFIVLTGFFNIIRGGGIRNLDNPPQPIDLKIALLYGQLMRAGAGSTETFYKVYEGIQEGKIDIEFGKQYLILPYTPIPRIFWPEKPIVSYFWRLTEALEGRIPGPGQRVLTSTILGEAYHQFGLTGVFLTPSIYMLILYFYIFYLSMYENTEIIIWMTMIHLPMNIRGGLASAVTSFMQTVTVFFLLSFIIYSSSRRCDKHNPLKSLYPF